MEHHQCPSCGHGPWNVHELKDGICPVCEPDDDEDVYYCRSCLAMFEEECACEDDEN